MASNNPFEKVPSTKTDAPPAAAGGAAAAGAAAPAPAAPSAMPPPTVPVAQQAPGAPQATYPQGTYPPPPAGYAGYPAVAGPGGVPPPGAPLPYPGAPPPPGFAHNWSSPWYACCGNFSRPATDAGTCLAGTFCTPCTLGWVNYKAMAATTTAAALLGGAYFLLLYGSQLADSAGQAGYAEPLARCAEDPAYCPPSIGGWTWALLALSVALLVAAAYLAARHRTQLRLKHSLPGSPGTDFLLWFCCAPCAACQEARTTLYAPINGGVWGAPPAPAGGVPPPPPPAAAQTQAPAKVQEMGKLGDDAKV